MLQRIYGTVWFSQKDLDAYLTRIEEAERRDHRKLGRELDLFSFHEVAGAGLPLYHPKGARTLRLMQEWLAAHGQSVPDTSSWRHMTMPGMLTAAQLEALDASRGADFDQTYLRLMIQHHEGALAMVDTLFATPRAGQDVDISVFANDVQQVQTAEIGMMQQMLADQ